MNYSQQHLPAHLLSRFCMAGINYQEAGIALRGAFSVSRDDFAQIAQLAKLRNLRSVFVLSTCNRTEIYGFADDVRTLVDLLTGQARGSYDDFISCAYHRTGEAAMQHLFRVAAGLDSQILGDYEILGQLKQSVDLAREHDLVGPIMGRVVSYAFQASKKIKTETALSSGTVSVSYAAIEMLKQGCSENRQNILVVGAGKFGGNVCKNLREYLPNSNVTITNRTDDTAWQMAEKHGLGFLPYTRLQQGIEAADVVIVCTNSPEPTVLPEHFLNNRDTTLLLDLSVPANVHPSLKSAENIRIIDVDEISKSILDRTFAKRQQEVPRARQILQQYQQEFLQWLQEYRYSLHIKHWKDKLLEIRPTATQAQKAVTRLAVNLKTSHDKGCLFINAINDYLQMS